MKRRSLLAGAVLLFAAFAVQALLTVYRRSDGKHQVRYNHHPLFYFHGNSSTPPGDKKPGDARGQGFADA